MTITGSPVQSSPEKRFAGLDHLRALAIIMVFLYHYLMFGRPEGLDAIGSWGWTGVDLFFVLSGYLVGGQLLGRIARDQPISYGTFYFKRSLRILPAYFVVLILYFAIPAFKERSELPPPWRFITFTQNFGLDLTRHGAFSHAWSLCIEEQFYIVLPLFVILLTAFNRSKKALWLLPALFVLGFVARIFNWYHFLEPLLTNPDLQDQFGRNYYKWIYYPTYTRLDGLLAGIAIATIFHFRPDIWKRINRHGNLLLFISVISIALAWLICHGEYQYSFRGAVFGYPAVALAYGIMVMAALSPTSILYRVSLRASHFIANLSYAIYLTHKQIIHLTHVVLNKYGLDNDSYLLFLVCILTALAGGMVLHYAVEKPFLRFRDKWVARHR